MNEQTVNNSTIDISNLPTADNALMWYVAFLPLFGIVFNIYATSIYHGFLLWGLVIVVRIAVCIYDNKKLIRLGMWNGDRISPTVLFPIVYIIKRFSWLKRSSAITAFAVASLILAVINNGFVKNALATDETFCEYVSQYYSSYITNLPQGDGLTANNEYIIDVLIHKYCYGEIYTSQEDSKIEYSYQEEGSERIVTASGMISDKKLVIRFILDYDGYYFNGLEVDTVELGGKILDGEEKDNILIDIFMNNAADKEAE